MQHPWLVQLALLVVLVLGWMSPAIIAQTDGSGSAAFAPATVRPPVDAVPAPAADVHDDMRTVLLKVGSVPCSEHVRSRLFLLLFENNRALHYQCLSDCKYQFLPANKDKATPEQIAAAARSKACVMLFSGVILANFPECDIDFISPRSRAEVLLRIKKDIDDHAAVPTQEQFYQFYNLNRVINLLNENESLVIDAFRNTSTRTSLWELTKMMNHVYVQPDVMLAEDMTILVRDSVAVKTTPPGWKQANLMLTLADPSKSSASSSSAGSYQGDSSTAGTPPAVLPSQAPAAINETVQSSRAASHSRRSSAVVGTAAAFMALYLWP